MRPQHLGIILDGNRRFAKRLMLQPWKGHEYGAEKIQKLLKWCDKLKIKELTLYCLSVENIKKRPKTELDYLFRLFRKEFREIKREQIEKNKIKIRFIGNLNLLPKDLADQCRKLEKQTESNSNYTINFALAYGGREEIINAVKKILSNKLSSNQINKKILEKNLWLSSEPDLVIRTGGEKRTSNFLPWQTTYSEWIFLDKMWPEFEEQDLINSIKEFEKRKRRFGR